MRQSVNTAASEKTWNATQNVAGKAFQNEKNNLEIATLCGVVMSLATIVNGGPELS